MTWPSTSCSKTYSTWSKTESFPQTAYGEISKLFHVNRSCQSCENLFCQSDFLST